MDNLAIYNAVRKVPESAKRAILAGRLKGKTDINPMWRLKALTDQFGPCGIGWKHAITDKRLENGANGEISAFLDIDLFVKVGGAWSDAIPGTGGSALVAKEKAGLYTSDECFKMALTDAISVACKALGFGADVYWDADRSKYNKSDRDPIVEEIPGGAQEPVGPSCDMCGRVIATKKCGGKEYSVADIIAGSMAKYKKQLCWTCMMAAKKEHENGTG